tara:strand:- start:475 stop:681 length:207 start_codon:yes stop_codon:yes gene_type:complete
MFEILIISIGLVLVIEGLLYFFLADKLYDVLNLLKNTNPQKIKTLSLSILVFGLCLIYFTFRYYSGTD